MSGQLVEQWPLKTLGELCQIRRGQSPRPIKAHITDDENGVNWIKIKDAGDDGKYIFKAKQKIHKKSAEKLVIVNDGDFILTNSMSFGRPYIVRTTGCVHDGWLILSEYQNHLNQDYLYYALNSPNVSNQFEQMARGSTVRNLNIELVKKTVLPVPPLEEQQRIVSILDETFENIETSYLKLNSKKEAANDLFRTTLASIFNDSSLVKNRLGDVCDFQNGFAFKSSTFRETGTPVLRISNIQNESIDLEKLVFINPQDYSQDLSRYIVKKYDLLIAMSGATTGKIGFNLRDTSLLQNQRVGKFEPHDQLMKKFLFYFLLTKVEESLRISAGTAQPNLSTKQIKDFLIPLPSLQQQKKIIEKLDSLSIQSKNLSLNYTDNQKRFVELKQSILQDVFSGKLTGGIVA